MTKPTVAVTRLIPEKGIDLLGEQYEIRQWRSNAPPPAKDLKELLSGCDAALTLLSDTIDAELLDACPELKIVANMAVGFENVDIQAAAERGIWVSNTPDVLTEATADLTLGLILAAARRIVESDQFMRTGKYEQWDPLLLRGMELSGKTIGIIGLGRIGKAVARRARAFGMSVIYFSRSRHGEFEQETAARSVTFAECIHNSHVVSLHLPYSEEQHHLFGAEQFAAMRPDALFINTARGKLMDEAALVHALQEGEIAGAGLDVYEHEPAFESALKELTNVVMLPHIGSATLETRDAMAELAAKNIRAVLSGQPPVSPVNQPQGLKE